jgi:hypothetical protein
MPTSRSFLGLFLFLSLCVGGAAPLLAQLTPMSDWKLRVTVDEALIRILPELDSPQAAVVPKGTILHAYASLGAWFRVLTNSAKDGRLVMGYISTSDVEIIEEKPLETAEFWPTEGEIYRGAGITLRAWGGLSTFSSADLDAACEGMAARTGAEIEALGYGLVSRDVAALHSGGSIGAELSYELSPRISLGLGFTYTRANRENVYAFITTGNIECDLDATALVQVYAYKLDAAYTIPLNKTFSLVLHGGPAFYHVRNVFKIAFEGLDFAQNFFQDTHQDAFGVNAGLALNVHLNSRAAIFAEALGRTVRFASLSGAEVFTKYTDSGLALDDRFSGDLYYRAGGTYPETAVRSAPPAGPGEVRKAVLPFAGFDFLFGFRIKF